MKKLLISSITVLLLLGCNQKPKDQQRNQTEKDTASKINNLPRTIKKALEAHGGYETWKEYATLIFTVNTNSSNEKHHVDLNSRKILIRHDSFKIGYDGEQVWVAPDKKTFGKRSPRFYHNLFFYFFSFPFVMTDDGVVLKPRGNKIIKGKAYETVKVSYKEGVGDASEDHYIAYFDTEDYQLEWLLYTVTYFSGQANTNYNELHYSEWQTVDELLVPRKIIGYKYADDSVTNQETYQAVFSDVQFSEKDLEDHIFEMPEKAEIDSASQK